MADGGRREPALGEAGQPASPRAAIDPSGLLPDIKGYIETSFLDWPGRIASVIFLAGCNFRCPYCHNFTLVESPHTLHSHDLETILERLSLFQGWIDGVVVSGGEPTLSPGLDNLLARLKKAGFQVKLDTNGYRPEVLEDLFARELVDMVAMDLKAPLDGLAYSRAAGRGVNVDRVRRSVELIVASGLPHEFRSTILPGWHGETELDSMGRSLRGCRNWTLQAMNPATAWNREALPGPKPYTQEELDSLQQQASRRLRETGTA